MVQPSGVTEQTGFVFERQMRIEASPDTVFEFFTDPEKMKLWMGVDAELDPRPGGTHRITVLSMAIARGEYVRVEPPSFVSFTWGWEGEGQPVAPGKSLVEVTLHSDGDATILEMRHSGLPSQGSATEHEHGWTHYLGRLAVAASGGDAGRDPNLDAEPPS